MIGVGNMEIKLKLSSLLILFLFFSSIIFAQEEQSPLDKIKQADKKACDFMLSTSDWRILSIIGLILSSVFIAALYLYGSVIDSSFKDRAKSELYQLFFTALLIAFFSLIVSLMCGDFISSIFQTQGSAYIASYNYLNTLARDYIQKTTVQLGLMSTVVSLISGTEVEGYKKTSTVLSWLSDPLNFFSDSLLALFGTLILAYVIVITQINILAIIPYLSLMFFIPIGIIFRSIYPFRKFGGALIGLGIGLYVFVPIVLLFNNLFMQQFDAPQISLESLQMRCIDDNDCYSHMCIYTDPPGFKNCQPMKDAGAYCNNNFECKSGLCLETAGGKKCSECGIEGSNNPLCCPGYIRNEQTKLCTLAKSNGELCSSDSECISGLCRSVDNIKKCVPKKKVGESCSEDIECISRSCSGIAPDKKCKQTLLNEADKQTVLSQYATYVSKSPDSLSSSQFEVSTSGIGTIKGVQDQNLIEDQLKSEVSLSSENISLGLFYDLIIAPIVLVFILGVLLPILNITLISKAVSDLSGALGAEIEIAEIWKLI